MEPKNYGQEIAPRAAVLELSPRAEVGDNYLELDPAATDEEIAEVWRRLRRAEASVHWCLGDFLVAVEKLRTSEHAARLMEAFGVGDRTAYRARQVCEAIPRAQRVRGGGFYLHLEALAEVGEPAAAVEWVRRAVEAGWSIAAMRAAINAARSAQSAVAQRAAVRTEKLRLAEVYGAVSFAARTPVERLSPSDRATLRRDLEPLVRWYEGL